VTHRFLAPIGSLALRLLVFFIDLHSSLAFLITGVEQLLESEAVRADGVASLSQTHTTGREGKGERVSLEGERPMLLRRMETVGHRGDVALSENSCSSGFLHTSGIG
jgi:hypothetical protein